MEWNGMEWNGTGIEWNGDIRLAKHVSCMMWPTAVTQIMSSPKATLTHTHVSSTALSSLLPGMESCLKHKWIRMEWNGMEWNGMEWNGTTRRTDVHCLVTRYGATVERQVPAVVCREGFGVGLYGSEQ